MLRRRIGRPGLLGTMARTAVISGTSTAVSNRVSGRAHRAAQQEAVVRQGQTQATAQQALAQQQAAAGAQPPPPRADDRIARLQKLGELQQSGVLTEKEFSSEKARILAS